MYTRSQTSGNRRGDLERTSSLSFSVTSVRILACSSKQEILGRLDIFSAMLLRNSRYAGFIIIYKQKIVIIVKHREVIKLRR